MSGLEAVGAISSVIQILEAAVNIVQACRDINGLPAAVREAYNRIPLIVATLKLAEEGLDSHADPKYHLDLLQYLGFCQTKAEDLKKIFDTIIPKQQGKTKWSVRRRLTNAAMMTLQLGKSKKIDSLTRGLLDDIGLLANNRALNAHIGKHIEASTKAIQLGQEPPAPPPAVLAYLQQRHEQVTMIQQQQSMVQNHRQASTFNSHGRGSQYIFTGNGAQNVNTGSGSFFTGDMSGAFHFGTPTRAATTPV